MAEIRKAEALGSAEIAVLTRLLAEVVADGSSIGFLADTPAEAMAAFWQQTAQKLGAGHHLWIAEEEGEAVGSIQLAQAGMPNSRHRGEILKLMVSPRFRRRGIAAQLLNEAVQFAGARGLTLLVLDTEEGSSGPAFYESQGWERSGVIPNFATDTAGRLITTVVYWQRV
jgi:acetyltransferase